MASPNSLSGQRRRPLKKRQPLARSNSSLLGTIKNLVTAPLAWFASTDDFEDTKDLKGKRRRVANVPTELPAEEDDRNSRNKRLRMHSPPRDHKPPFGDAYGYLDPPGSAFQQNHQPSIFNQSNSTRSVSLSSPVPTYNSSHNHLNSIHASNLSRTMSIDPPSRPASRSSTFTSIPIPINRDTSMDSSMKALSLRRDLSMPPLSGRPSFRMRTSITPTPPTHREVSEPPPINTLASNPMFVRGPSQTESHQNGLSRKASVTLGSLVESVRSTRSPSRQRNSLLFGTGPELNAHNITVQENPAEKALHELDIYKTPLVPTRLRSSNPLTSNTSSVDLFKSRRGAHLVLMQDNTHMNRLGRKVSGKKETILVNETKPYAGEGGMKKLLARRKMEVEEAEEAKEAKSVNVVILTQDNGDDIEVNKKKTDKELKSALDPIPVPVPVPPKSDWFLTASGSTASSMSMTSSSLRVGRNKRAHIARPTTRPMKTKFSAAYEDDDPMDDNEGDQEAERRKERAVLDEAAKRAPLFEIPQGFTFAKVDQQIQHNTTDIKEPPIASLPFSFSKPALTPQPQEATQETMPIASPVPDITLSQPTPVVHEPMTSDSSNSGNVPNFFATSSVFAKPLNVPQPPPLTFPVPQSKPLKDSENPLWVGENRKEKLSTPVPPLGLFSDFQEAKDEAAASDIPIPLSEKVILPSVSPSRTSSTSGLVPPVLTPSIPGNITKKDDTVSVTPGSIFPSVPRDFSFSQQSTTETFTSTQPPKPTLFDGKFTSPPNSETQKPAMMFGDDTPKTVASPISFSFSQPMASTTPSVATSNSLFGGNTSAAPVEPSKSNINEGFSFNIKEKEPKPTDMTFSFGAPHTTPPVEPKKDTPFSFGVPIETSRPAAPTTMAFSFSNSSNTSDTGNKQFSFGTPSSMAPSDRPSTPPKSQDQECSMDESPTRDAQPVHANNKPTDRPNLGFSFSSYTPGSIFGGQSNAPAPIPSSSPFSFNTTSPSPNPFAKGSKADENKPFGGFGQTLTVPSNAPGFTFGQSKPSDNGNAARPSTPNSFGFSGSTSLSTTNLGSNFTFGNSTDTSTNTPFGQNIQASGSTSTPNSPSTFNQSSPFSFATSLPPINTGFTFGSQPASPAGGNSALPQSTAPGSFSAGGGFGQAQPSSPFGAPAATAPGSSNGTLFTIGAPPSAPAGARAIRKLPNRRGGTKR